MNDEVTLPDGMTIAKSEIAAYGVSKDWQIIIRFLSIGIFLALPILFLPFVSRETLNNLLWKPAYIDISTVCSSIEGDNLNLCYLATQKGQRWTTRPPINLPQLFPILLLLLPMWWSAATLLRIGTMTLDAPVKESKFLMGIFSFSILAFLFRVVEIITSYPQRIPFQIDLYLIVIVLLAILGIMSLFTREAAQQITVHRLVLKSGAKITKIDFRSDSPLRS
jgi:hypothetical protein